MKFSDRIYIIGHTIDKAIDLGIQAAYPLVFNMPTPDPPPDWKRIVRLSWRMVRTTAKETSRILLTEWIS
jgi:hypothetical protein